MLMISALQADGLDNDGTATMRVWTTNFKMYNVNLVNTYGEGSQALAVSAQAEVGATGSKVATYHADDE